MNSVELHRELTQLLKQVSTLEQSLDALPTTRKQRQRLNTTIDNMRRNIARLLAVTPAVVLKEAVLEGYGGEKRHPRGRKHDERYRDDGSRHRDDRAARPAPQHGPTTGTQVEDKRRSAPTTKKPVETRQAPAPKAQPVKPKPARAMGGDAFSGLMKAVKAESFADGRLQVMKTAARHHRFTVNQVIMLIKTLSFADKKLSAVRGLYPRVIDPQNAYKLQSAFTFESDKRKLRAILENK